MSREDWAPGASSTVFINCIVDGVWQRRRLGVMNAYAADGHSPWFREERRAEVVTHVCQETYLACFPPGVWVCCSLSLSPRLPAG